MSWVQTATGRRFNFNDIESNEISVIDIAWALGHQCRYNGHSSEFYSVAEHSVQMSYAALVNGASREVALEMLLHDAAEAYMGDLVRPLKQMLPAYTEYEKRLMRHIRKSLGCTANEWEHVKIVKEYDHRILMNEKDDLLKNIADPIEWGVPVEAAALGRLNVTLEFWKPELAAVNFLYAYRGLVIGTVPDTHFFTADKALNAFAHGVKIIDY